MPVHARTHAVFGHFQNLNLLALLHDLASGRAAQGAWSSGGLLCPVAHGLPYRHDVLGLAALGQTADLVLGCDHAARRPYQNYRLKVIGHLAGDRFELRQEDIYQKVAELESARGRRRS